MNNHLSLFTLSLYPLAAVSCHECNRSFCLPCYVLPLPLSAEIYIDIRESICSDSWHFFFFGENISTSYNLRIFFSSSDKLGYVKMSYLTLLLRQTRVLPRRKKMKAWTGYIIVQQKTKSRREISIIIVLERQFTFVIMWKKTRTNSYFKTLQAELRRLTSNPYFPVKLIT